ncbi:MAG: hypothetical protein KDJ38_14075 [Gammaproteobacteria bacterium]|nr:hypothetical protein [Gammaproteobacteria bacterium]
MNDLPEGRLQELLLDYGLEVVFQSAGEVIVGSYWGDEEAGLVANRLYLRGDTPVHSALHEACHFICMDEQRRDRLHTDAGGDYDEENAVCYLQILLAGRLREMGMRRMFRDMDRWGYTFRLGSAERWFRNDADDARSWLQQRGLLVDENPADRLSL